MHILWMCAVLGGKSYLEFCLDNQIPLASSFLESKRLETCYLQTGYLQGCVGGDV